MAKSPTSERGLPRHPFFYTLDQVATLLALDLDRLKVGWVHYQGRTPGVHRKDRLLAVNVAPVDQKPEWRIPEYELVRWMRLKRIFVY